MELTLGQIAEMTQTELAGDRGKRILGAAPFEQATGDQITFAANSTFIKQLEQAAAGAVIVPRDCRRPGLNLLLAENPFLAFTRVRQHFHPVRKPTPGISAQAAIGEGFQCGAAAYIAPAVTIGNRVTIGDGVALHSGVVVADGVTLGDDVVVHPNVSILERCRIGNRVVIHAGSVIGSDGFGFAHDGRHYHKVPHIGIVEIGDDVEIGAGNTVDRATYGTTRIGSGVKTDNLVHIGHNCTIGPDTIIVAQVGISGSVNVGAHVVIAGQVGIAEHLSIGEGAIIGPQSGLGKDVPAGQVVTGTPALPHRFYLRVQTLVSRLPEFKKALSGLEKRLQRLEQKLSGK